MDSSFWFDTINLGLSVAYIKGPQVIVSKNIAFLSLKINFVIANSADLDKMTHFAFIWGKVQNFQNPELLKTKF